MRATKRQRYNMVKGLLPLFNFAITDLAYPLVSLNYGFVVNDTYSGISLTSTLPLRASQSCLRMCIRRLAINLFDVTRIGSVTGSSPFSLGYLPSFKRRLMFLFSNFLAFLCSSKAFGKALKSTAFSDFISMLLVIESVFVRMLCSIPVLRCFLVSLVFVRHKVIIYENTQ